ncbi:hypothetical protein Hanom_Chr13g01220081 [Helianthus anomalus]
MLTFWVKTVDWSLFDFVDPPPPPNAALRSAIRVVGEQEASVLSIHADHFLLPATTVDSSPKPR